MFGMNRFKRMFSGSTTFTGDSPFETYYGSILRDRQDGGPSAEEARRDFQHIRETVSRISVY
jgi:hypothetical protein